MATADVLRWAVQRSSRNRILSYDKAARSQQPPHSDPTADAVAPARAPHLDAPRRRLTVPTRLLAVLSPLRSLRSRFALVMGMGGIAFALLLTGFMQWRWELGTEQAVRQGLQLTAQKIARRLVEDLDSREHEVALLADLVGRTNHVDPATLRPLLDNLKQRQPDYAWIGFAASDGRVVAASDGLLEQDNVAARPWFGAGLRDVFRGDPHEAKLLAAFVRRGAGGEPARFVDVAVPVRNARNEVIGVLGAHLYFDWVQTIIGAATAEFGTEGTLEVLLADRNGAWLVKPAAETAADLAALDAQGANDTYFSARARLTAPTAPDSLAWTVLVREQTRLAFAPIHDNRRLMLLFSVLLATAFAGATWLICGRIVRPIVALADIARSHQEGKDLPAAAGREDETGVVGRVMHQLAFHDVLTGLANRRQLLDRLAQSLRAGLYREHYGALLLIDLDHFSLLNDSKGHDVGDQLLIAVAARLAAAARPADTLARLGGDEFVLLLAGLSAHRERAVRQAEERAALVRQVLQEPFVLGGEPYLCKASMGIRLFREQEASGADVLKHANVAMAEAKRAGRDTLRFFDASMQTTLEERFQLETQLRQAIGGELVLLYQKQVDSRGEVLGAEVLVRWRHPVMGMVSPARFIPLAEETGLIIPIGRWVLDTACRQIRRWALNPATRRLTLAVNVSAKEFGQPDYVDQVLQTLSATGADPTRLKLELTESVLAADVKAVVAKMNALKASGISFSLDDFGTGFSSLTYLQKMPLAQLKIDQSFVRDVTTSAGDAAIARTVIALGQSLGLAVIAEGVETDAQRSFLSASGCHFFQGYLFGRPIPLDEFEDMVRQQPVGP